MALYPDVAPAAPVSRDDLAALLAMQQAQGLAGGQQAGDASSVDIGALFGSNTPSFESGQPAPGRDAVSASLADFGGAMTTANAGMITDTTNTDRSTINPFSEDALGDRASQSFNSFSNASPVATTATAGFPGWGGPGAPGSQFGSSTTNQPGATPVSTTSFTQPATNTFSDRWGGLPSSLPAGNLFEGQPTPSLFDPNAQALPAQTPTPTPTYAGRVTPNSYTQPTPTPDPDEDVADPGTNTPSNDFSAAGFSGFGGFGAFGGGNATGGYEGSASMSNTGGAQGFEGVGGAPGTGGAGVGGTSAAGTGTGNEGGGAVGGFGGESGSSSSSSSSGDNTGGSSGVG